MCQQKFHSKCFFGTGQHWLWMWPDSGMKYFCYYSGSGLITDDVKNSQTQTLTIISVIALPFLVLLLNPCWVYSMIRKFIPLQCESGTSQPCVLWSFILCHRPEEVGGGGTWGNFCKVCAAGLSESLLYYFVASYRPHLGHSWENVI